MRVDRAFFLASICLALALILVAAWGEPVDDTYGPPTTTPPVEVELP